MFIPRPAHEPLDSEGRVPRGSDPKSMRLAELVPPRFTVAMRDSEIPQAAHEPLGADTPVCATGRFKGAKRAGSPGWSLPGNDGQPAAKSADKLDSMTRHSIKLLECSRDRGARPSRSLQSAS